MTRWHPVLDPRVPLAQRPGPWRLWMVAWRIWQPWQLGSARWTIHCWFNGTKVRGWEHIWNDINHLGGQLKSWSLPENWCVDCFTNMWLYSLAAWTLQGTDYSHHFFIPPKKFLYKMGTPRGPTKPFFVQHNVAYLDVQDWFPIL